MLKVFRDLNLGVKIGGGFAILIIIAAIMAFVGYNGLNNVDHDVKIANEAADELANMAGDLTNAVNRFRL